MRVVGLGMSTSLPFSPGVKYNSGLLRVRRPEADNVCTHVQPLAQGEAQVNGGCDICLCGTGALESRDSQHRGPPTHKTHAVPEFDQK